MKNQTVDASSTLTAFTVDNVTANPTDEGVSSANPPETTISETGQPKFTSHIRKNIINQIRGVTLTPEDADAIVEELGHVAHGWNRVFPPKKPTAVQIFNGVVTPMMQVLLYDVLGVIDASIPNKEQNRAVKRIIQDGFDKAYLEIVKETYPDSNFSVRPGHALTPSPDRINAILGGNVKMKSAE
jgi:hypothetical protein